MSAPTVTLKGLTWGHRRAIAPLAATAAPFAKIEPGIVVEWSVRDLKAFEHQPLEETVDMFDMVVFDHPFVGRIAGSGLFSPVDAVLRSVAGAADPRSYAGPSLTSYQWGGSTWGVPIDAATMHAIWRPDLMQALGATVPRTWDEVVSLGRLARERGLYLGLANGDHHGLLSIGSLMHNAGAGWTSDPEGGLTLNLAAFRTGLAQLKAITAFAHPDSVGWNSIALHDAMTTRDDLVYCPLTYGYATYGEADFGQRRLGFSDAPMAQAPFCAGTLVGGTAIGLSARTRHREAAERYLRFVLDPAVQTEFGAHHGQPARIESWRDAALDERFNGYFSGVAETLASAAVRPRFSGYGDFEAAAGKLLVSHLTGGIEEADLIEQLGKLAVASGGQATA